MDGGVWESVKQMESGITFKLRAAKYGLSVESLDAMYLSQDGRCAICYADDRSLVIDHHHPTQIVRALLCSKCNSVVGSIEGDRSNMGKRWCNRYLAYIDSFTYYAEQICFKLT
jgi:hypothetical protein